MYWNIINLPDRDPDPYPPELYWSSTESRANTAMGVDFNDISSITYNGFPPYTYTWSDGSTSTGT